MGCMLALKSGGIFFFLLRRTYLAFHLLDTSRTTHNACSLLRGEVYVYVELS